MWEPGSTWRLALPQDLAAKAWTSSLSITWADILQLGRGKSVCIELFHHVLKAASDLKAWKYMEIHGGHSAAFQCKDVDPVRVCLCRFWVRLGWALYVTLWHLTIFCHEWSGIFTDIINQLKDIKRLCSAFFCRELKGCFHGSLQKMSMPIHANPYLHVLRVRSILRGHQRYQYHCHSFWDSICSASDSPYQSWGNMGEPWD